MAKAKDTGARGLRSIVEEIMLDIMYELPDRTAKEKGKYVVTARGRPQGEEPLRHPARAADPGQVGLGAEEGKRLSRAS